VLAFTTAEIVKIAVNLPWNRVTPDRVQVGSFLASAVAWIWLLCDSERGLPSVCLSGDSLQRFVASVSFASASGFLVIEAWHFLVMVAAMMTPLLVPPIRHVIARSYCWRRHRAVLLFVIGFAAVWLLAGAVVVVLLAGLSGSGFEKGPIAAAAILLAAAWHFSSGRARSLRRCHRTVALAPRGWPADRDCLSYGGMQGTACLGSCLPVMVATMLAFPGTAAAALLAFWLYWERGYQRNDRLTSTAVLLILGFTLLIPAVLARPV
jgi:hypothetical protein